MLTKKEERGNGFLVKFIKHYTDIWNKNCIHKEREWPSASYYENTILFLSSFVIITGKSEEQSISSQKKYVSFKKSSRWWIQLKI